MVQDTRSWLDTLRKFGSELGLPKVDVDKLIDTHRKNLDALEQSAQVAAEGAKSLAASSGKLLRRHFAKRLQSRTISSRRGIRRRLSPGKPSSRERPSILRSRIPATSRSSQPRRPPMRPRSSANGCAQAWANLVPACAGPTEPDQG
jgi:hypothetical protein